MEINNMTNQLVTKDFFIATMNIIAENTSFNYSTLAINGIKEQLSEDFKFSKSIRINGKSVEVDRSINSVSKNELKKFLKKIVNLIGPNYLKILLAQRLNIRSLGYLEGLGIKFG